MLTDMHEQVTTDCGTSVSVIVCHVKHLNF